MAVQRLLWKKCSFILNWELGSSAIGRKDDSGSTAQGAENSTQIIMNFSRYFSSHLIAERSLKVQWNSQSQRVLREKQNLQKSNLRFKTEVSIFQCLLELVQDHVVPYKQLIHSSYNIIFLALCVTWVNTAFHIKWSSCNSWRPSVCEGKMCITFLRLKNSEKWWEVLRGKELSVWGTFLL